MTGRNPAPARITTRFVAARRASASNAPATLIQDIAKLTDGADAVEIDLLELFAAIRHQLHITSTLKFSIAQNLQDQTSKAMTFMSNHRATPFMTGIAPVYARTKAFAAVTALVVLCVLLAVAGSKAAEPSAKGTLDGLGGSAAAPSAVAAKAGRETPANSNREQNKDAPDSASGAAASAKAALAVAPKAKLAPDIAKPLKLLEDEISAREKTIERVKNADNLLAAQRDHLEGFGARADKLIELAAPRLKETLSLIKRLGPPPGKDKPAESKAVAATRAQLNKRKILLQGAITTAELIKERAQQLIADIQLKRQDLFTKDLIRRSTSPLSPSLWKEIAATGPTALQHVGSMGRAWLKLAQPYTVYLLLVAVVAISLGAYLRHLFNGLVQRRLTISDSHQPGLSERSSIIRWLLPARIIPYGAAMVILFGGLYLMDLLKAPIGTVLIAVAKSLAIVLIVQAGARTVLAPRRPNWRLVNLSTRVAWRLQVIIILIASVFALDVILSEFARALLQPISIRVMQTFTSNIMLGGLLLAFGLLPFEPGWNRPVSSEGAEDDSGAEKDRTSARAASTQAKATADQSAAAVETGDPPPKSWSPAQVLLLRGTVLLYAVTIMISSALGYVAFGRFLAHQIVISGTIIGVGLLLHFAIRAYSREIASGGHRSNLLKNKLSFGKSSQNLVAKILAGFLNLGLVLALAPWLLLQWGFTSTQIMSWGKRALFGFDIGGYHISLSKLALGILLFVGLLLATRQLQRWLDRIILSRPNVDSGIANSVRTAVGYAGILVACLAGISYAGFDISNIALVAGALSVGIGFGLQSIVNNFVSGLILLVGRPIKVGDWIVAGSAEGYVRRISVRATEIETFDRATVIVPNSDLISSRVTNWTHRNTLGRVMVNVGVSYDADPEQVRDLLIKIAKANDRVMKFPAPSVHFIDLGSSSLDFSLRAFIPDVNQRMTVATQLRLAIISEFRAASIEIPYPQQDIHMRDLDGVKQVMTKVIAERNRKQTTEID